jgi:AcrR family transcriptional regulator
MRKSPDGAAELTRATLLAAALAELAGGSVETLTMRAVAVRAGVAERTVFRYFATRDAFLDGVTEAVSATLDLPRAPTEPGGLVEYVASLYARFEAHSALTRAALHPEIFQRMVETVSKDRWHVTQRCLDAAFPHRPAEERRVAAANIRYFSSATTWNYYRSHFGFSLEETTLAAQTLIRQALAALHEGPTPRARRA